MIKFQPLLDDKYQALTENAEAEELAPSYPDMLDFGKLEIIRAVNPDIRERNKAIAGLKRFAADECLVRWHTGAVSIVHHGTFQTIWNSTPIETRQRIQVLRHYWLGNIGSAINMQDAPARRGEVFDKWISDKLIGSLVKQVQEYKENVKVAAVHFNMQQQKQQFNGEGRFYKEAIINNYNGVGLQYSTYKYDLLRALAGETDEFPDIPEHSLTKEEYAELKRQCLPLSKKEKKTQAEEPNTLNK